MATMELSRQWAPKSNTKALHRLSRTEIIALFSSALLISGCLAYQSAITLRQSPARPDVDIGRLVDANNRFAVEMFSNLSSSGGNLFFSPFSIFVALGMVNEGARAATAEEMRSVFHFPADNQTRLSLFKAFLTRMNSPGEGSALLTANALWIDRKFEVQTGYKNDLSRYYGAEASNVDFDQAPEEARLRINKWIMDRTGEKIKELLPEGSIDAESRLLLTNAIYFNGRWLKEFDRSATHGMLFHPDPEDSVQVEMMVMCGEKSKFGYGESDGMQLLEMMYSGGRLSMLVLLPDAANTSGLERSLDIDRLGEWKSKMDEQRVDIGFPKFTVGSRYGLNGCLSGMGMPSAFDEQTADFSGIDGKKDLYISNVIHQADISLDEKGTEASVATAAVVSVNAEIEPRIPWFVADHPFIFLIQDKATGTILFMGRVSDPTA